MDDVPQLDNERHLRYWQRCLRTLLPQAYTSNDSIRMTLGCFILAAIDLLSPPPAATATASSSVSPDQPPKPSKASAAALTPSDRLTIREWVLWCQHPGGGFCGAPTHALRAHDYEGWDFDAQRAETGSSGAANLAATYFALALLALVAEDGAAEATFSGVRRNETLSWLRRLQRDDGSFGEVLYDIPAQARARSGGEKWAVAGGRDTRYCYLAASVRWMLRGDVKEGDSGWVQDINVEGLVQHIRQGQTYDGGFAETSSHESHAGYAYCAISALSLLDRPSEGSSSPHDSPILRRGIAGVPALTQWLASRPFEYLEDREETDDNADEDNFVQPSSAEGHGDPAEAIKYAGFNGRTNKVADTCYTWWVSGTLSILGLKQEHLIPLDSARRFLLEKTEHIIGGFAKHPRGPPDVYHAYLGLAALATLGQGTDTEESRLKEFDSALVLSMDAVRRIEAGRRRLLRPSGMVGEEQLQQMGLDMLGKEAPSWLKAVTS